MNLGLASWQGFLRFQFGEKRGKKEKVIPIKGLD